jgi:putative nucleotidyltransferase with HDIG domain
MAKKKISIDKIEIGMFIEADVRDAAKGKGATASSGKNVLLLGKGMLVTSQNQVRRLKEAGLNEVTIDTTKGKDSAGGRVQQAPPAQMREKAKPKPAGGRKTFFKDEVQVARKIRGASVKIVKDFMGNAAQGASIDHEKVELASKTLTGSVFRNVDALISLTALKDYSDHTYTHSVNVCCLTLAIAFASGVTEEEAAIIGIGGLLHDIGKSKIPLSVLDKPGPLTDDERKVIMSHPLFGEEILKTMDNVAEEAFFITGQHHEKVSGAGYPRGLSGSEIHPWAKMAAVADVYDALTSARPYKPGLPPHIALRVIFDGKGTDFDESVVDTFIKQLGIYPVGSFVKLNTEEMGVVMEVNPDDAMRPRVGVIFTQFGKRRPSPFVVDLFKEFKDRGPENSPSIVGADDPRYFKVNVEDYLEVPG